MIIIKNIVILGASGHAKVIIDILHNLKDYDFKLYDNIFLLDDNEELLLTHIMGHEVIGKIRDCLKYNDAEFIIGIGNNHIRKRIAQEYKLNYISAIHPKSIIAEDVQIETGTVVMAGAIINSGSRIGLHNIINTGATIDHDTTILDYVHISPGVHMGGSVFVNELSWLGIGSVVINNVNIGRGCIVGAGTVLIHNVTDNCKVVGNPARIIT